jgi:hypothetical protein
MAINISNEEKGVYYEDTDANKRRFFVRNQHEPILIDGVIQLEKVEDRSRFRVADHLNSVGIILDMGTPIPLPGTMEELFDILRVFFLDRNVGGESLYRTITMPQQLSGTNSIAYTGFAVDLLATTAEAKWAVKRMHQDNSETWAGRFTFDQILDNYLSLTYT